VSSCVGEFFVICDEQCVCVLEIHELFFEEKSVLIQNCVAAENVSVIGKMQPSLSNHWTGINSDQIGLNEKIHWTKVPLTWAARTLRTQ